MLRLNRHCHHEHTNPPLNSNNPPSSSSSSSTQPPKPNPKVLSFILQAFVMTLVFSLFFVFVGIAVIIFLHLCLVGGALHRRRRHHRHPALSPADLNSLPRFKPTPSSAQLCAICIDDCSDGDWCRQLPDCGHVFHSDCIDRWLAKSPGCPVCRTPVRLICRRENNNVDDVAGVQDSSARLWYAFG